jgi:hypothetical protein
MPLVVKDRVRETTTTNGTGTVTLAGAVTGFQSFSAIGDANTTYYTINLPGANEWEVGIGTYTASGTTLSRDTVLASSNGGSLVSFSAGTKDVFCTYPAGRSVYYDTSTNVTLNALTLSGGTANGVLYLDGSKVATTGSALTFDGTTLATRVTASGTFQLAYSGTNLTNADFNVRIANNLTDLQVSSATPLSFTLGASEQMRLTTTGLGIGTSSPVSKLQVTDANKGFDNYGNLNVFTSDTATVGAGGAIGFGGNNATGGTSPYVFAKIQGIKEGATNTWNGALLFGTTAGSSAVIEHMRLDSSGNLGIGTSSPGYKLEVNGVAGVNTSNANAAEFHIKNTSASARDWVLLSTGSAWAGGGQTGYFNIYDNTAGQQRLTIDTSGNLGIGASSPQNDTGYGGLTLNGTSGSIITLRTANANVGRIYATGTDFLNIDANGTASGTIVFRNGTSSTERMRLDSSGNLGLGVTPSAWALTGLQAFQIKNGALYGYANDEVGITANCFYDTAIGNWKYISTGAVSTRYRQNAGIHSWYTAPSGNTNDPVSFTQAMTLDASGNLGVGTTSPTYKLHVANGYFGLFRQTTYNASAAIGIDLGASNSDCVNNSATYAWGQEVVGDANGQALTFKSYRRNDTTVERARITSGGQLLVGTTSVSGSETVRVYNAANSRIQIDQASNGLVVGADASGPFLDTIGSNRLAFFLAGSERARITSDGNLLVGGTSNAVGARAILENASGNQLGLRYTGVATYYNSVDSSGNLIWTKDGTERARITGSGTFQTSLDASIYGVTVGRGGGAVGTNTAVGASALAANTTGAFNTTVGSQALTTNTTGERNTVIGRQAMFLNTTGGYNVAVGMNAMEQNTTASNSVAVGYTALQLNTTGANNVAVGYNALVSNTTASNNTAVGFQAGYYNQTGPELTTVGYRALYNATDGYNTAVGWSAGLGQTTGIANTYIGRGTGSVNTLTGSFNTAVGNYAYARGTTGGYNVAVGAGALELNTTASNNTAVGYQAGYSNTTGVVTAVGYQAGYSLTTGDIVAIGNNAGRSVTTAVGNSFVGLGAGFSTTTGNNNTVVGGNVTGVLNPAFYSNTTGADNAAFGSGALTSNTTGGANTAIGSRALAFNTTASNNTAVGFQAGYSNTTSNEVSAFGYLAAFSNTTGAQTTAFGSRALYSNTTGNYNAAFGKSVLLNNTTGTANAAFGGEVIGTGFPTLFYNTTGSFNTAFGVSALANNTTASTNTVVGYQAGYNNTTGRVVALGYNAAYGNTTGSITAVGWQAGKSNTTGVANTAVGNSYITYAPLEFNTTGSYNSAFGEGALALNTTANNNTAHGAYALYSNTTADSNTAVGFASAYSNTTGFNITAVGRNALYYNTTGNYNTGIGNEALRSNTTAEHNTSLGYAAGSNTTTGGANTAIGSNSLLSNTTGIANSAVGFAALFTNSTGNYNTAQGFAALYYTTATNNSAFGGYALFNNSSGTQNTAIGKDALYANTTASNNTAVGYQAGYSNTTGSVNVSVGYRAGFSNSTGINNIFIGAYAGEGVGASTITGNGNTAVGASAGASLTTGTYNTFVGAAGQVNQGSGGLITTGSKNTILGPYNGYQGGLDIRTANNYIVLSDGDGNPNFVVRRSSGGAYFLCGPTLSDPTGSNYYSTLSTDSADVQLILQRTGSAAGWGGIGASDGYALNVYSEGLAGVPLRVAETGALILLGGAGSANGTGITFPATQSASSNANTLDDYEQGTFTPTVGGTWTTSPTDLSGTYVKIGRQVYIRVYFNGAAVKSSATAGWIDSLPFTVVVEGTGSGSDNAVGDVGNVLFANSTRMWLTANSFIAGANYFSGTYLAAD